MKKVIKLTENDLSRIVKRVINEKYVDLPYEDDDDMYDIYEADTRKITDSIMGLLKPYYEKHGFDITETLLDDIMGYHKAGLLDFDYYND
jgi:hypothetical protein